MMLLSGSTMPLWWVEHPHLCREGMASAAVRKLFVLCIPVSLVLQLDDCSVPVVLTSKGVSVGELCNLSTHAAQEDSELLVVEGSDSCHLESESVSWVGHLLQYVCRKGSNFISDLRIAGDEEDLVGENSVVQVGRTFGKGLIDCTDDICDRCCPCGRQSRRDCDGTIEVSAFRGGLEVGCGLGLLARLGDTPKPEEPRFFW